MKRLAFVVCFLVPSVLFGDSSRSEKPKPPPVVSSIDDITDANLPVQMMGSRATLKGGEMLVFNKVHKDLVMKILATKVTPTLVTVKVGMTGSLC